MTSNEEIPEMKLDSTKYSSKKQEPLNQDQEKAKKEIEKSKEKLEKLKNFIIKKYNFIQAIGILPPQSIKLFIDEENLSESFPNEIENISKSVHFYVIIPEEKLKEIPKMKSEIIKEVQKEKQQVWIHIKTPIDIWENCLDSKFDIVSSISMSFPLYDKGILGALRVAEIHKSLVLRKFEKYVVSYVIAGSLVRGTAIKTSDVDVFIIINDTDVKRMPRLELKEKLRNIIFEYVNQAAGIAGVKNKLSPQVYLLTDFWESVKDAHPVIFTFIRDGVPIYDRGTFMPWKALLKMGKLKPSPEAIDIFMSMGDKTVKRVKKTLLDVVVGDIYWGVLTPSQALLMLYGLPPPTPKQTVAEMKHVFVDKEKMLEKKYVDILENVVSLYKDYEHEKLKEIKGSEIDKLLNDVDSYLKRLKELKEQIEKRENEKIIEQIYEDVFKLLEMLVGKKSQDKMLEDFENTFIKKGFFPPQDSRILRNIVSARKEFKKGKLNMHKVNEARKEAFILINDITEYNQRCELTNKKEE